MADREKYYIPIEGARIEVEKVSQEMFWRCSTS